MADIKALTARLCVLCENLYGEEFAGKYITTREAFRDWLNEKTGLSIDHTKDKEAALSAWVDKLEELST